MRDRLIELINEAEYESLKYEMANKIYPFDDYKSRSEFVADHLLANGVIVPPCKVGDTVYCIMAKSGLSGGLIFTGRIIKRKVDKLIYDGNRWEMKSDRIYPDYKDGNELIYAFFGDLVFVSEDEAKKRLDEILAVGEEAEKALKERAE